MIGKEILESKPLSIPEVRELLERIEESNKDFEMTTQQRIVYEYVKKFSKIAPDKAREMLEELSKLGLPREICVKIVDIMPEDLDDLRTILGKSSYAADKNLLENILEIVSRYREG